MTRMPCTCGDSGICIACVLAELDPGWNVPPVALAPEPEPDIDELRVSLDETVAAALSLAANVAERVTALASDVVARDAAELALTVGLAANLSLLLRRERQLRRAVKAEVAG